MQNGVLWILGVGTGIFLFFWGNSGVFFGWQGFKEYSCMFCWGLKIDSLMRVVGILVCVGVEK